MKLLFKWLERLSLDAVLVALSWGYALDKVGGKPDQLWSIFILGCATWLTYVADRLWEVRPGTGSPDTDRHLYYRNNYNQFKFIWLGGFALTILVAASFLPAWKVTWGWLLVGLIVLYLWLIGGMKDASLRLLLKRTIVPVIFAFGVVWMVESWRTLAGITGSLMLLAAAFANVLLISYWENHDEKMPGWLPGFVAGSLLLMLFSANLALFIHWQLGIAGLLCTGIYFVLLVQIKTGKATFVRAWVDGALFGAGMLVVLIPCN